MAVRPPQDDTSEPDAIEFGIAALAARLEEREVEYPATDGELLDALGDQSIPYDAAGNSVRLSEALEAADADRFESEADLLDRLHPVFERYRERASLSLLGRLRALLPF